MCEATPRIVVSPPCSPLKAAANDAVGLPLALGFLSGYGSAEMRSKRTGQTLKSQTSCPTHPAMTWIWNAMYPLAGYAAYLTVKDFDAAITPLETDNALAAFKLYWVQLGLNLLWPPVFVGQGQSMVGLGIMTCLFGTVAAMTAKMNNLFTPVNTTWFLAPYLGFLGYNLYENFVAVKNSQHA